jgi:hypothetical protein
MLTPRTSCSGTERAFAVFSQEKNDHIVLQTVRMWERRICATFKDLVSYVAKGWLFAADVRERMTNAVGMGLAGRGEARRIVREQVLCLCDTQS